MATNSIKLALTCALCNNISYIEQVDSGNGLYSYLHFGCLVMFCTAISAMYFNLICLPG